MYNAAVITISDRSFKGLREDKSGPVLSGLLEGDGYLVKVKRIIPDEFEIIKETLEELSRDGDISLVLTTGGTGFSQRDVTPEATKQVIERDASGICEAMRYNSLKITEKAMLSRAVSGIKGETLIINMPGSPKACFECYNFVREALVHGLGILTGRESD